VPTIDNQPLQAAADTIFVFVKSSSCPVGCPPTYCKYGCLFCTNAGVFPGANAAAQAAAVVTPIVYGNTSCAAGPCADKYIGIRSTNCNTGNFSSGTLVRITNTPSNSVGIHTGNGGKDISIVRFTQGLPACGNWSDATIVLPSTLPADGEVPTPLITSIGVIGGGALLLALGTLVLAVRLRRQVEPQIDAVEMSTR
jgi:hypothetical protein